MPNHWESSARPLFVKTVFVNGNRHAILFEKDPLLRCASSPFKKTSRPNSSLSFTSDFSISSSESQTSISEYKTFKFENTSRNQRKDISSELQSCLIKFKLASDSLKNKNKWEEEQAFCNSKIGYKGTENSKQKVHKENRGKNWKLCENFYEEQKKFKLTEKNSRDKSCYIYHLENYKGKKNYCFVKITSESSQFRLKCSCESDWNETHKCNSQKKNNLVISATVQNLIMAPDENENLFEKTLDYILPFENSELHWKNYLTRSYYNSLADRVFQWLDLARKRKSTPGTLNMTTDVTSCDTTTERIFSGKKFEKEITENEEPYRTKYKASNNKKTEKFLRSDESEEETEEKVVQKQNVKTFLSMEKIKNHFEEYLLETKPLRKVSNEFVGNKSQQMGKSSISHDLNLSINFTSTISTKETNSSILNIIKTPLKIQDSFLISPLKESDSLKNHNIKKIKELRNASSLQNRHKETGHSDFATSHNWRGRNKRGVFVEKSDNRKRHSECFCNGNLDKCADNKSSRMLTEEFAEGNQKSINNPNITRSKSVLIQNLSPQQHNKISSLKEEKIVWASEKSTGRLQLHIFMPTVLLKDQNDENMSECESILNF